MKRNATIIDHYIYPLVNKGSQTEAFSRASIKFGLFHKKLENKRHIGLKYDWIVWRLINYTQAYTNEYIGRDIQNFGNFDEL